MKQIIVLYRQVLAALPAGGRRFVNLYSWLLASLAVFDAAALGLLAAVAGPVAAGTTVKLPILGELTTTGVIGAILAVCVLMIVRGVLATGVMWWAMRRVPVYEVSLGDTLFRGFVGSPWRERLRKSSTDVMRLTDSGVNVTVNGFLMPGATLVAELVTLVVVMGTLAILQPVLAAVTLAYLSLIAAVLFFWIARRARRAGEINVKNTLHTSRLVVEVIGAMKEITLRNKEAEVADVIDGVRERSARARGNVSFFGQVPRYALEAGLVGGFVLVGGMGMALGGLQEALAAVALFALAGFRVAPSVIRFQTVLSSMVAVQHYPRLVIEELAASRADLVGSAGPDAKATGRPLPETASSIVMRDVSFRYDLDARPALEHVSLEIPFGATVAVVGASGSGKSTMIDLLLGLLEPDSGELVVGDSPLADVRDAWRARVGYVPQEVAIFDASIAQNVALVWDENFDRERVRRALEGAQLGEFLANRTGGIDARVGERGLALSGGQRQRLGIARALYADPLVLVLDEATSALDTQTERDVADAISAIGEGVTKIIVAHRLATIRDADVIFFLRDGRVVGSGTFDHLTRVIPDFAKQADLAGLL
jgi:ABC-type bacteriocin/lantibiotic exporter with double-glycine peptidase domain